ncbi:hypothetical protein LOZ65_006918, partial [Ophidiomyces ophidiicola]
DAAVLRGLDAHRGAERESGALRLGGRCGAGEYGVSDRPSAQAGRGREQRSDVLLHGAGALPPGADDPPEHCGEVGRV